MAYIPLKIAYSFCNSKFKTLGPNVLVFFLAIFSLFFGCNRKEQLDDEVDKLGRATDPVNKTQHSVPLAGMPAAMPPGASSSIPSVGLQKVITGTVLESIDASRYTYIKLNSGDSKEEIWAAVLKTKIEPGQTVSIVQEIVMHNFQSPTLKRTFDSIVFGVIKETETAGDAGPLPVQQEKMLPPGHPPILTTPQ